jgi:sugar phosphate permease
VTTLVTAWISDRIGRRAPGIMICFAIAFVGLLTEFLLPKTTAFVHARYGALFLIPSESTIHCAIVC